jgi:uncharacterized membrane protein
MRQWPVSLIFQSLFYVAGGINHFWHQSSYLNIMPDHYSHPEALVKISGAAEILGGIGLLVPGARRVSAAGISAMLVVFLDVHLFMLRHQDRFPTVPKWILWARLPLQAVLIAWAWHYTRRDAGTYSGQSGSRTRSGSQA